MYEDKVEDILNAKRASGQKSETDNVPFDVDRHAACSWSRLEAEKTLDPTFMSMMAADEHPNAEQKAFLEHFVRRLKVEVFEERQRTVGASRQEALLDLVHGFPGTGKGCVIAWCVIAWMRQLMEGALGWSHGRQFLCLAF